MASSHLQGTGDADNRAVSERRSLNAAIHDVSPIESARARFLRIVVDHFTALVIREMAEAVGCEDDNTTRHGPDRARKRKSEGVRYEGDPRYACPVMYVVNIYETLVNEVDFRLASLDGFQGKTIGVDLEAAGGLYQQLARKFPEKGPLTFKRRELNTPVDTRRWFPEFVVQEEAEERAVNFVVVNGLKIVKKPDTVSVFDTEWFKKLTGRSKVSISVQAYKFYSPRHNPLLSIPCLPVKKKLSSSKGNSPPKAPQTQPPLGLSVSCSAKSMESKADVKPPHISQRQGTTYKPHVHYPYVYEVPSFMFPFIYDFHDDFASGHNGFQVIAEEVELGGTGEGGWCGVRRDMLLEFVYSRDKYALVYTSETVKRIVKALAVWTISATLPEQQFSALDMGHLVATTFEVVFVVLAPQAEQCVTFLPLHNTFCLAHPLNIHEIYLVYLHHQKRFITLKADDDLPLPPIHPLWHLHHDTSVDGLDQRYADRIRDFEWLESCMVPTPSVEKCD